MLSRLLPLGLLACQTEIPSPVPEDLVPGPPVAGVAEGYLDLPVGAPMGGYSDRCRYLGGNTAAPTQGSNYVYAFVPSVGLQTRPAAKALWLENGDEDLVLLKLDLIYSFDGLVEAVEDTLAAETGRDLDGRVVVATSHSHASFGNFSDQQQFYLGGDRYNEEIFQRLVGSVTTVALEAWASRQPAALGLGLAKDWDPADEVYRDRRGENDALQVFDDIPAGSYKDPNLWVLRVDSAEGDALGLFFSFGMHGTVLDSDSPMLSIESTGHVELAVQEGFDHPVVVAHLQAGGGDASPAGSDEGYARLEALGEVAAPSILELWAQTPTSTDPIALETVTRGLPEGRDEIAVTRNGTVDWVYAPYDPDLVPDDVLYEDDGSVKSPIDEFNVPYGAAFCGSGVDGLSDIGTGSQVYPYNTCLDVAFMSSVLINWFGLVDFDGVSELPLPLPESQRANASASRIGPLVLREADGSESTDDVLFGFFPGEPTAWYTEQFRRRALAEGDWTHALPVGYAQDHEGYLLLPEDWLMGGYEPNINVMGPLQGEHILEGVLAIADGPLRTDVHEPQDPLGRWQTTTYPVRALPTEAPDLTPDAGTPLDSVPADLWLPVDLVPEASPAQQVPRVQGVAQLLWQGGDPAVDTPEVVLQELLDGVWHNVQSSSGREIRTGMPDILLVYLPQPLSPASAEQTHIWWAGWQAVAHSGERAGLPRGTYRLKVTGRRALGGTDTWPWPSETYALASAPFQVVAAEITASVSADSVSAWLAAPTGGWRLIDLNGSSRGTNPLTGGALVWTLADGSTWEDPTSGSTSGGVTVFSTSPPSGAVSLSITDAYGNEGTLEL